MYLWLSDSVVVIHFGFVVFVLAGGLLVLRWRWIVGLHLPAITWGVLVELMHWTCPLTFLENWLRMRGGASAYRGDFVTHYLLPILYPAHLTAHIQIALGIFVIALNAFVYGVIILRCNRQTLRPDQTGKPAPR